MNASIDEQVFINLYNSGKSDIELSEIFNISDRTIERYEQKLRVKGKIKFRKDLNNEKHKFKHSEILPEVGRYLDSAKEIIESHQDIYQDVKLTTTWKREKQTEDLALMWSDMHTGTINKFPITGEVTYNQQIQEKELKTLFSGVKRFAQLYRPTYNLETFYIIDAGDNITNDRIYEGQKSNITCEVGEQIIKTLEYQSDFIKNALELFPRVVMIKEYGNHGRTTSKPISESATSNFEYMLGLLLKERFRDNKRVEIVLPKSYYYSFTIRGHKYLLTHGNHIRGTALTSIERAVQQVTLLAGREMYDVILMGHFHNALKLRVTPHTTLLVNGCFIYNDDYAYTKLRKFSSATQYLFNISKRSPMHNLQEIELTW